MQREGVSKPLGGLEGHSQGLVMLQYCLVSYRQAGLPLLSKVEA